MSRQTAPPSQRQRLDQRALDIRGADPMAGRTAERKAGYGGIRNEWTEEFTNAMFSQQRDQLAEQYGHVERELHRQLTLGQVTPAQYSAELRHLKTRRAGAVSASMRDIKICLLYTSPSPRDRQRSRMPSSA